MRMLWIALFSFHYKKQINDILSCAAIQARQGDSIMKRITRIIRPIICIVVLLVAMTTAVRGCYYAHCENKLGGRDKLVKNTTIFGHSASNCDPDGVRFTKLYRYMDADFVKEHPYIYLSVDGEDMIFQITALFVTDIGFDYIAPDPAGDDLTSFFETIARKNWLDFDGVTFSEEDTVLTLSTCCRKYDKANSGNQRLVVMAKLLPEGATAQEFSVSLVDSPEMP